MTTSDREAFVWIWLPGATQPVVAGRVWQEGDRLLFNYGRSYLQRDAAMAIDPVALSLRQGRLEPRHGHAVHGAIRDAAPDAWGRRVIIYRLLGRKGGDVDTARLDELTYLLESGSNRIGALDFQRSATDYAPRGTDHVPLAMLLEVAERVQQGKPLPPALDQALFHGSSIGGARPKALLQDGDRQYIAKFSASTDLYSVVKAEFIAMRLAALAGLDVAGVRMAQAGGKNVLLIERFDRQRRTDGWSRKAMLSALTLQGLDEMTARYASYETLAEIIRHRFAEPRHTLHELFARLVFNILCGNTDDHARNHAAFLDGETLRLTPAYDICPQGRTGNEASQAMRIDGSNNLSQLRTCLSAARHFQLSIAQARRICDRLIASIEQHWSSVCDACELEPVERKLLWGRQFLNPFSLQR